MIAEKLIKEDDLEINPGENLNILMSALRKIIDNITGDVYVKIRVEKLIRSIIEAAQKLPDPIDPYCMAYENMENCLDRRDDSDCLKCQNYSDKITLEKFYELFNDESIEEARSHFMPCPTAFEMARRWGIIQTNQKK